MAILRPRRCARCAPHVLRHVDWLRFIMAVAAWHNARLRLTSPALVIPPATSRSPDGLREGVRPNPGPPLFDDRKCPGSLTAARRVRSPGPAKRRRDTRFTAFCCVVCVWADPIRSGARKSPLGRCDVAFLYLVAIMDRHTRKALAWRISNTMDAEFCGEALNEALHTFGPPDGMNTDQGCRFTSFAWTNRLRRSNLPVSMDGTGPVPSLRL